MKTKTKVANRLVRNPYLSEQEEKLAKFCEQNGISFIKRSDLAGRGKTHYELDFKPEFLDEVEAKVSQHLDRTGIRYKFAVDKGGTHHYEFAEMIELEPIDGKGEVVIDRKYVEHCIAEMPKLKRDYQREIKLVENDSEIEHYKKQNEKNEQEIKKIEETIKPLAWWQTALKYLWKSYRLKLEQTQKDTQSQLKKLRDKIEDNNCSINRIKAEKEWTRDMLVLADIWDKSVEPTPKVTVLDENELLKEADKLLKEVDEKLDDDIPMFIKKKRKHISI